MGQTVLGVVPAGTGLGTPSHLLAMPEVLGAAMLGTVGAFNDRRDYLKEDAGRAAEGREGMNLVDQSAAARIGIFPASMTMLSSFLVK